MTASASPVAPVTARSPRSMIARLLAGDGRDRRPEPVGVVEVDVGDRGDPAVPGVGRVEPAAEPHLDQREVEPRLGEVAEDDGGQQLELGRWRRAAGATRSASGRTSPTSRANVAASIGRPSTCDPLPIGDQVRLWRLADPEPGGPQRAPGEGEDAALAVRARDERAADAELRVAELAEQGPRPAEPEPDAEPAAVGQRRSASSYVRSGRRARSAARRHSRVSSSS